MALRHLLDSACIKYAKDGSEYRNNLDNTYIDVQNVGSGKYRVMHHSYISVPLATYNTEQEANDALKGLAEKDVKSSGAYRSLDALATQLEALDAKLDRILDEIRMLPPSSGGAEYQAASQRFAQQKSE